MFDGGGLRRTGRGELQPGQIEFDAPLYAVFPCLPDNRSWFLGRAAMDLLFALQAMQRNRCRTSRRMSATGQEVGTESITLAAHGG